MRLKRIGGSILFIGVVLMSCLAIGAVAYRVQQERRLAGEQEWKLEERRLKSRVGIEMRDRVMQSRACFDELAGSWAGSVNWGELFRALIDLGPEDMEIGKLDLEMDYGYLLDSPNDGDIRGAPSRDYHLVMAAWIPSGQADRHVSDFVRRLQRSDVVSAHVDRVQAQGMQRLEPSEQHPRGRTLFAIRMTFAPMALLR